MFLAVGFGRNQMMFFFYRYQLFFILYYLTIIMPFETMASVSQSYLIVSNSGWEFAPLDENALFLQETIANSIISCSSRCHMSTICRVFNFDIQTKRCRLYEGDIDTTGTIIASVYSHSVYGFIKLTSEDFVNYGYPCSSCEGSRLLTCINSVCQCQPRTYFDGSICRSQNLNAGACSDYIQCRHDLNLTCQSNMQCGCEYHPTLS